MRKFVKNLLCAVLVLLPVFCLGSAALAAQPVLTVDDCVKCHSEEPAQITANGASHKTEINCLECHRGHRPSSPNNIPQCSECHSGNAHYEVSEPCLSCHNPHQPLKISIVGEQKQVCVSCHADPEKQMVDNPTQHATFSCNFCHADTHGNIPECVSCHEPHSATMTQADCAACHKAHMPLAVSFPDSTASELCAACHDTVLATLSASKTKHSQLLCATCHAGKHKTVPACTDCHGQPHPKAMHERFPKCGDCHGIAHDLNK
jgi:predicted CXXCH cytochrome family protein